MIFRQEIRATRAKVLRLGEGMEVIPHIAIFDSHDVARVAERRNGFGELDIDQFTAATVGGGVAQGGGVRGLDGGWRMEENWPGW
jgi:hypothetical protein